MADPSSDFFKYGRGYAMYSQGMTDVGRQASKDPVTGQETNATEAELIKAAIDRDTLIIARATGNDLTLTEYKNIYDSVEFLHGRYRDQRITNAVYQEKLWSIPDTIRKERNQKPKPHYTPNRDAKTGQPIASSAPDASAMPTETMRKLSPDMFDAGDKIDFKSFWDSVVETAGVSKENWSHEALQRERAQAGGQPLGDGGHPGSTGSIPGESAGSIPPAMPSRSGGFLDQFQAGLDAIGIVEPTPFADGTNAAISAIRALADPQNAGTHLRNAGISLISALVPYAGDAAKLAKYGEKIGRNTKGGKLLHSLGLAGLAGGGTGGGGGAGGGSGGIPASGDDGSGGDLLGGLVGTVGNLTKAMGPVGFAVAGAVLGLKSFVDWMGKIDSKSRQMIEEQRKLAQFDGGLAGSYATLDNERLLRDIDRAQQVSGSMGRLTRAQSANEAAWHELVTPFASLKNDIQTFFVNMSTYAIQIIDYLEPISELLATWYGEDKDKTMATSAAQYLAREANDRMSKRKL